MLTHERALIYEIDQTALLSKIATLAIKILRNSSAASVRVTGAAAITEPANIRRGKRTWAKSRLVADDRLGPMLTWGHPVEIGRNATAKEVGPPAIGI
jgi:hypothetical protein